ncbi:hypothetical protein D5S17_16475 [Pseudonocardiaceae bacterium YIM PH 21723]|nr:hypothetical protein D5S17_16475 [Pseudonocardiaceae bacterium YIM PH 21723]
MRGGTDVSSARDDDQRATHHHLRETLSTTAQGLARIAGSAWTSGLSILAVSALVIAGLFLGFSHSWAAIVHSLAGLVSLLLLFSIQHSTNRQTQAILLKLDEIVHATDGADNRVIAAEERELHVQQRLESRHSPQ